MLNTFAPSAVMPPSANRKHCTMSTAESSHLRSDLLTAELDVARLTAALKDGDDPTADFHPPAEASPELVLTQRRFLINQAAEHRAKIAALDRQKAQKEAELGTINATVGKLEAVLPVLQERVAVEVPGEEDGGDAHHR